MKFETYNKQKMYLIGVRETKKISGQNSHQQHVTNIKIKIL